MDSFRVVGRSHRHHCQETLLKWSLYAIGCRASVTSIPDKSPLLIMPRGLWFNTNDISIPKLNGLDVKKQYFCVQKERKKQLSMPSGNKANSPNWVETLWSSGSCACLCQAAAEFGMEEDPPKDVCRRYDGRQRALGIAKRFLAGQWEDTPCPPSGLRWLAASSFPNSSEALGCRCGLPWLIQPWIKLLNHNVKESRPDSYPIRLGERCSNAALAHWPASWRHTCFSKRGVGEIWTCSGIWLHPLSVASFIFW